MYDVGADKFNRDRIARVDLELRGSISKLSRLDPKCPLLRDNGPDWQWSQGHDQSSHYKEEK
jgi:hypothetical protein